MDFWDQALTSARSTGYWKDVHACGRIIDEFHIVIIEALRAGKFSGDAHETERRWTEVHQAELNYRQLMENEARQVAPPHDPSSWWNVLEVAPDAAPEHVRAAYTAKLKRCHPDRVAGLAPEIENLATDMCRRLTEALKRRRDAHPTRKPSRGLRNKSS
jgi:hypothetical protein